jgi:hypothetical protein
MLKPVSAAIEIGPTRKINIIGGILSFKLGKEIVFKVYA